MGCHRGPTPPETVIGSKLGRFGQIFARRVRAVMTDAADTHGGFDPALLMLYGRDIAVEEGIACEPMSQVELAEVMGVTPQAIGKTARQLEDAGLITRTTSKCDGRVKLLTTTCAGACAAQLGQAEYDVFAKELFGGIAPSDLEAFERVLDLLTLRLLCPCEDSGGSEKAQGSEGCA